MTDFNHTADVERRLDDLRDRVDRLDAELRRHPRWTATDVYLVLMGVLLVVLVAGGYVVEAVGR